ncbi:MAG: hypothetical protein ABI356_07910 [Steroidobacteraceae bacterium]
MNALLKTSSLIVLCCAINVTYAQQPAPSTAPSTATSDTAAPPAKNSKATPQSEAGEPRANTSRAPTAQSEAGEPHANTSRPAAAGRSSATAGAKVPGAADRLELGTATVTGDREQPKVMYIVPWKKSDIGDLAGKPMNSLVDEILAPVDRDVFKREVVYYKAVQADSSQNGAPGHP